MTTVVTNVCVSLIFFIINKIEIKYSVISGVYYSNYKLNQNIGPNEPDQTVRVKIITRIVVFRLTIRTKENSIR